MLTASREEIDGSSLWNRALLNFVPAALLKSIKLFKGGNLRYSWLQYLPDRPLLSDFFEQLQQTALRLISKKPILESSSGELDEPCRLYYVPDLFRDEDGVPFAQCEYTASRYLSTSYSSKDWSKLELLGVKRLSDRDFLHHLSHFISEDGNEYEQKPPQWHSCLARKLTQLVTTSAEYRSIASELKLVPLRDGRWASPSVGNLLFPNDERVLTVPNGIEVMEVHRGASDDSYRRQLLTLLGAKEFAAQKICEIIIKTHSNPGFCPLDIPCADLVYHAIFLYLAGWIDPFGRGLWFVAENETRYRGVQLYIDSETPHAATKYLDVRRAQFPFLHSEYLKSNLTMRDDFVDWLVECQNLSRIPRLVSLLDESRFSLSKEFQFLLDTYPSSRILLLLRDHWGCYAELIDGSYDHPHRKDSMLKLREQLGSMKVTCRNNTVEFLNRTFLPLSGFQHEDYLSVPLLDVPDPNDCNWSFLSLLGVTIKVDVEHFVQQLQALQTDEPSLDRVASLYHQIYLSSHGDLGSIRYAASWRG